MAAESFVDRESELGLIDEVLGQIRLGEGGNLCLLGVPGAGKTSILKEYIGRRRARWEEEGVVLVYVSLTDLGNSPHELAAGFVGEVLARVAFTFKAEIDISELRRAETFASCAANIQSRAVSAFIESLQQMPVGESPHPEGLVRSAFRFPDAFAVEKRIRIILFVDNFDDLKKYAHPAMAAFAEFQQALEGQAEAFYVTAMTHSPFADRVFSGSGAPLAGRFRTALLRGIETGPAADLALSVMGGEETPRSRKAAELIARLSSGIPVILRHIARATRSAAGDDPPSEGAVARGFVAEVLSPLGKVYRHYLTCIQQAVGEKAEYLSARNVLAHLAEGKAVRPEEIGERTGLDLETVARLVGRVLASGLFRNVDDSFYFDDPLFRFWALKTEPSLEPGNVKLPEEKALALADEYLQRFREGPAKPAPGKGKKFNFRELISACKGRTVPGQTLGRTEPVDFPLFEKVKGFAFSSKQVKMYYLEGDGQYWGLMIVWLPMPVDRAEVEILAQQSRGKLDRIWFVCRGGFTPAAREAAEEYAVFLSDEGDLRRLVENLA
jgi:hypothetical protein